MNDRYLYRAKRIDNGELVEGFYAVIGEKTVIIEKEREEFYDVEGEKKSHGNKIVEVDPSTICQCTAVPDRDNTIMFENDVVRASGGVRGVIRFGRYGDEKTDYGFYIEWEKSQPYWRNDIYYWQNELRVIGSYIDNPELLEVGE